MRNKIYLLALLLLLMHLPTLAQIGGDYNPNNPGDPGTPVQKYTLTLKGNPADAGNFNITSTKLAAGENYTIKAYSNQSSNPGFVFVAWLCDGDTISKSASYTITMPAHDLEIIGVYTYDPSSPSDPNPQATKYQLTILAEPMNSGSFNINSERYEAGSVHTLYAYTNTDFVFKHWRIGDTILSTNQNMDFTMPAHNVTIIGQFEYDPANPASPNANYWNQLTGEVIVDDFQPGKLSNAISTLLNRYGANKNDVQSIIVAGQMTSNDFGIANTYSNCAILDLSRVTGITEIPSYAFDYTNLESVYLPASIEKIGNSAFYQCTKLYSLTVYAMTPPQLGSSVFGGVPEGLVVYVPAAALTLYQNDPNWNKYILLPIQDGIRSLTVNLPSGANPADYTHMWLELTNTKNGQRMHLVMTDKMSYKFNNIICNTSWDVVLRNPNGDIFGQIENVEVGDEDVSVTFGSLSKPYSVSLSVLTPLGQDVTSQAEITWTDADGNYITKEPSIAGLPLGYQVIYSVKLPQELAMAYIGPFNTQYTVKNGNNSIVCHLTAISNVTVSGKVKDGSTGLPLKGANITASQTFGGKYDKTISVTTDNSGEFTFEIAKVPTVFGASATDYINKSLAFDVMAATGNIVLPDLSLDPITGATISINFTYTPCHTSDEEAEPQNWYSDFNNVDYSIYNKTKNRSLDQFSAQYPQLVLLEDVNDGDVLELTATSRKNAFKPVKATVTIAEQKANATFNILELGKIAASFKNNSNPTVVGTLYDDSDKLVGTYNYSNAALEIDNLSDGNYTLITMGSSQFFNTIYDLTSLPQTGLISGVDYVRTAVQVQSGIISKIEINNVPLLDESKLYYTGENTSFTVNKTSIVIGNYLTLTGHLDFKPVYAGQVSNVSMIVDLPESCSFVENSVMVGNSTSVYYVDGNRVTIPMTRYTDRVRFCVIPIVGGNYAPSAIAQFDIDGKTIKQPIGSANYTAQELSINVPTSVAKTTIPIRGTAIGVCDIGIFDNDILIGQTTSLANGIWSTTCELNDPYNLSTHQVQAKITTRTGMVFNTEMKECVYDRYIIEPKTVTMSFYNGWMKKTVTAVFDFENGTTNPSSYSFYTATDFTFVADLTNNDTTVVSGVTLYIHTDKNEVRELVANYDKNLDKWVAVSHFDSYNLPVNIGISIHSYESTYADRGQFNLLANRVDEKREDAMGILNHIDEMEEAVNAIDEQMTIDEDVFAGLEDQINNATDNDEMNQLLVLWLTQAGLESSLEDFDDKTPETVDGQYIQTLITKAQELLDSSDYPDHTEEIETLLEQVNESLQDDDARFDYMASLWSAQSDTIIVDTENGTATLFRTTLEKYGDIPFEIADTIHMDMTDNSTVYIYVSTEDEVIIVDSLNNCVWYVNDQIAVQEVVKSSLLRDKGDFVAAMETARQKLTWLGNTVLSAVNGWIKEQEAERAAQEALRNTLEQQQAVLLGENAGLQIRINEIEKELQALTSPDVITLEEYFDIVDRDELVNKLKLERENVLKRIRTNHANINELTRGITRCGARIVAVTAVLGQLYELYQVGQGIFKTVSYVSTAIQDHGHWYSLINNILPCEADLERAVALKERCESDWSDIAWSKGYYPAFTITALATVVNGYMMTNKAAKIVAQVLISAITNFLNNTADALFHNARSASSSWYPKRYAEYRSLKCKEDEDPDDDHEPDKPNEPDDKKNPPLPPTDPIHDPSGFVYEGVPSNRLQGVTATCFYKETVEDMYGDLHDEVVLWDAEQYGQENPLFTDENGFYRWDVPVGMWQVKYEKAGYETVYSDWLPVPPPQLDVNIGMTQMRQPEVIKARAYTKAVEFEFDKYMKPEMLTTDNISVTANGVAVNGTIQLLNKEQAYESEETFASRVRFNATSPFNAEEVTLHVCHKVENYAGLHMSDDFEQTLTVEYEIEKIDVDTTINVLYGDSRQLIVTAHPARASKGKTLTVRTLSPLIISTDAESYTLDNNGKTVVIVHGDLPGMGSLLFGIDGYDVTAATEVNVIMENQMNVATPTASVASGSEVPKGTAVYLRCATEGATIYYTLDGSCPCDDTPARKLYDGTPIIVNGTVTIKAMATAPDLYDSDVVTFIYRVSDEINGDVNRDGEVNIADINVVIDVILNSNVSSDIRDRADVNGDGEVNIADINVIIDIILNPRNLMSHEVNCDDHIHLNNVTLKPGEVRNLQATLDNASHYSAMQCDIVLPAGLTLLNTASIGNNVTKVNNLDETSSRALSYSPTKVPFASNSQGILTLTVRADEALEAESEIVLTHVILADAENKAWHIADCKAQVNNTSGVNDLTAVADKVWVEGHTLFIEACHEGTAQLATINGIVCDIPVKAGVNQHRLDQGIYIVVINGVSHKIAIK